MTARYIEVQLAEAERRIAAALACHVRVDVRGYEDGSTDSLCTCGDEWDTVADRCSSPTVTALVGER